MAQQLIQELDNWLQKVTFQLIFANAMYSEDGTVDCKIFIDDLFQRKLNTRNIFVKCMSTYTNFGL